MPGVADEYEFCPMRRKVAPVFRGLALAVVGDGNVHLNLGLHVIGAASSQIDAEFDRADAA